MARLTPAANNSSLYGGRSRRPFSLLRLLGLLAALISGVMLFIGEAVVKPHLRDLFDEQVVTGMMATLYLLSLLGVLYIASRNKRNGEPMGILPIAAVVLATVSVGYALKGMGL